MMPGLFRSMMCGKRPTVPSGKGTSDTGHQAPGAASVSSTLPPTDSPRRKPSPVAEGAATVKCHWSAGNRKHGAPALGVVWKTARREHDAPPCPDLHLAFRRAQHRPADGAAVLEEAHRGRGRP